MDGEIKSSTHLRDDLIKKAVDFLIHPKLANAPLAEKKKFLSEKGLTINEIEDAMKSAGVKDETPELLPRATSTIVASNSRISSWRQWAVFSVIFSGLSYGLYLLAIKIARIVLFDRDRKIKDISQNVDNLKESVRLILKNQAHLQEVLVSHADDMNKSKTSLEMEPTNMSSSNILAIKELKNEVVSLKGLLLNKDQFPKAPVLKPIIPSWQLINNDDLSIKADVTEDESLVTSEENTESDQSSNSLNNEYLSIEKDATEKEIFDASEENTKSYRSSNTLNNDGLIIVDATEKEIMDASDENIKSAQSSISLNHDNSIDVISQNTHSLTEVHCEEMDSSILIVQKGDDSENEPYVCDSSDHPKMTVSDQQSEYMIDSIADSEDLIAYEENNDASEQLIVSD